MFTTDEIFARLMNGESMDAIAKEMTEALNAAKAKKEAEDKRKAEEEAKAKRQAVINDAAEKAANAVNELIRVMYPEMVNATEQLTGRMMIDMVDSSYALVKGVEKFMPMLEKLDVDDFEKLFCVEAEPKSLDSVAKEAQKAKEVIKQVEHELKPNPKVGGVTKAKPAATVEELSPQDVNNILSSFISTMM